MVGIVLLGVFVLLLAFGVVGEYIGKIYLETKARPRYRIETELDDREAEL